ncbi:hypothetical protein P7K49_012936, partial [Saguinus oedipus]
LPPEQSRLLNKAQNSSLQECAERPRGPGSLRSSRGTKQKRVQTPLRGLRATLAICLPLTFQQKPVKHGGVPSPREPRHVRGVEPGIREPGRERGGGELAAEADGPGA